MSSPKLLYVVQVVLKSYRKTPLTLALVFIAMCIGCAGLTSVLVINDAAKQSYANLNQPLVNAVSHLIVANPTKQLSQSDYSALRKQGFTNIIATAEQRVALENNESVVFFGLDYFAILSLAEELKDDASAALSQVSSANNARYLIDPQYAEQIGSAVYQRANETILANGQDYGPVKEMTGTRIGSQIVTDIAILYEDFPNAELSSLMVVGNGEVITALRNALPSHLRLTPVMSEVDAQELTGSFHLNLLAMGLLMFVVCLFVIMNALHLLMSKRVSTFKVMRQLGIGNTDIIQASVLEMLLLSLFATCVGVSLGIAAANWLSPAVNQTIEGLYNIRMTKGELSLASILIQSFGVCLLGSLIAVSLPLHRINQNLSIVTDNVVSPTSHYFWAGLAGLCLCLAALLLVVTHGVIWSFVIIALFIFCGCFSILALLPLGLRMMRNLVPNHLTLINWSLADALRISHRSSVALCAFFIAVAANIGMNLMVESFRDATQGWLEQRLDADAYVYAQETDQIIEWLDTHYPQVQTVLRLSDSGEFEEKEVQIRSFPVSPERQKSMLFDAAEDNVWDTFSNAQSVLINQQFALSKRLKLGDNILVTRTSGDDIAKPIAGIYYDYGNPKLQILVPPSVITRPDNERKILALYIAQNDQASITDLERQVGEKFPQANVLMTEGLLALSMQTFDRTFVITSALNIITLLVAAFSLATSVLIINQDNSAQRALLKSMGVTSRSLVMAEVMQYSFLCLLICLLAIPFGIGLSWLLINLVNVQAFFWSYPMTVPLGSLVEIVLTSMGLVIVTVVLPTVKSATTSLAEEIKCLDA